MRLKKPSRIWWGQNLTLKIGGLPNFLNPTPATPITYIKFALMSLNFTFIYVVIKFLVRPENLICWDCPNFPPSPIKSKGLGGGWVNVFW